jgi:CheY-like chemotaxis protein
MYSSSDKNSFYNSNKKDRNSINNKDGVYVENDDGNCCDDNYNNSSNSGKTSNHKQQQSFSPLQSSLFSPVKSPVQPLDFKFLVNEKNMNIINRPLRKPSASFCVNNDDEHQIEKKFDIHNRFPVVVSRTPNSEKSYLKNYSPINNNKNKNNNIYTEALFPLKISDTFKAKFRSFLKQNLKIVMCDDNQVCRKMFSKFCENEQLANVKIVNCAKDAIDLVLQNIDDRENAFDILFTDINSFFLLFIFIILFYFYTFISENISVNNIMIIVIHETYINKYKLTCKPLTLKIKKYTVH